MLRYFFLILGIVSVGESTHAQTLGRLFYDPAERAQLDQLRRLGGQAPTPSAQGPITVQVTPDQITVDGYVKRGNGKSTTWINQVPHYEQENGNGMIVQQRPNQPPRVFFHTQDGKLVGLKAGESLDKHTGQVREVYEPKPVDNLPSEEKNP